jgi:hypothetical protein
LGLQPVEGTRPMVASRHTLAQHQIDGAILRIFTGRIVRPTAEARPALDNTPLRRSGTTRELTVVVSGSGAPRPAVHGTQDEGELVGIEPGGSGLGNLREPGPNLIANLVRSNLGCLNHA